MALHRDIFWVGRQWAVTGAGVQAVDQRLRGILDIEINRLWDDDFVQSRRAKPGINVEDFDAALTMARSRYPRSGERTAANGAAPPLARRAASDTPVKGGAEVGSLIAMLSQLDSPKPRESWTVPAKVQPSAGGGSLEMRAEGRLARFLPQWRIRR